MPSERFMRHHYGASGYVAKVDDTLCENCGKPSQEHWAVNFADGPHVSGSVLVCPTAVFRLERDRLQGDPERHTTR